MNTRWLPALSVLALSGCATVHPASASQPDSLHQASLWLNHSAAVAARSLKTLDQITEVHLNRPAIAVTHVSRVSGLTDHLTLHWSGPVNLLLDGLAQKIGWRVQFTFVPHPTPDVAIWNTNAPLPVIVHQINRQMMHVATVEILPFSRTLALVRYQPKWLPEHPVLVSPPPQKIVSPGKVLTHGRVLTHGKVLTVGAHGHLYPIQTGSHGPNIPLKTALSEHWKLLLPDHPTQAELRIAHAWMQAGGILLRTK